MGFLEVKTRRCKCQQVSTSTCHAFCFGICGAVRNVCARAGTTRPRASADVRGRMGHYSIALVLPFGGHSVPVRLRLSNPQVAPWCPEAFLRSIIGHTHQAASCGLPGARQTPNAQPSCIEGAIIRASRQQRVGHSTSHGLLAHWHQLLIERHLIKLLTTSWPCLNGQFISSSFIFDNFLADEKSHDVTFQTHAIATDARKRKCMLQTLAHPN